MKIEILMLFIAILLAIPTPCISGIKVVNMNKKKFSIVFSHNINAETHPCGCRKSPLGGLPAVAGKLHQIKRDRNIVYVDTGDTFFPLTIKNDMRKSHRFIAENLAIALDKLGLKYFIPGDQDFLMGFNFLKKLLKNHRFMPLISNLKNDSTLTHKKFIKIIKGPHRIFLIGFVFPSILSKDTYSYFKEPSDTMPSLIKLLIKNGYNPKNSMHRLIVLSSGGMYNDLKIVNFNIDWIIGGHSQSLTLRPIVKNGTKIVQVLSRNHYLGEIIIDLTSDKRADNFKVHTIEENLQSKLTPNPFIAFIQRHKSKLSKIQLNEQKELISESFSNKLLQTSNYCLECHVPQWKRWSKTAHSISYMTLKIAGEQNNLSCIKCHSVGFKSKHGFKTSYDIFVFKDKKKRENYLKELENIFKGNKKPIRNLSPKKISIYARKWSSLDIGKGVIHNFANVQCLNCHSKSLNHPFGLSDTSFKESRDDIGKKCLQCHRPDQSPHWYNKNKKGLATIINKSILKKMINDVACPLRQ